MLLKELRSVIDEQATVDFIVDAGSNTVESGKLWLFNADQSIDDLQVKLLVPKDNYLLITLTTSPERMSNTDWNSVFNQQTITSLVDDDTDILEN